MTLQRLIAQHRHPSRLNPDSTWHVESFASQASSGIALQAGLAFATSQRRSDSVHNLHDQMAPMPPGSISVTPDKRSLSSPTELLQRAEGVCEERWETALEDPCAFSCPVPRVTAEGFRLRRAGGGESPLAASGHLAGSARELVDIPRRRLDGAMSSTMSVPSNPRACPTRTPWIGTACCRRRRAGQADGEGGPGKIVPARRTHANRRVARGQVLYQRWSQRIRIKPS